MQPGFERDEGWTIAADPVGLDDLVMCPSSHRVDDGPVFDRVGHVADAGEGGHGEGGDEFDLAAAGVPAGGGSVALMAGVEESAEFFVAVAGLGCPDGVGLVHQRCGWIVGCCADRPVYR